MSNNNQHLVFVYGSLKSGFENHDFHLKNQTLIKKNVITDDMYDMFSFGSFPAVTKKKQKGYIQGELYLVDDLGLAELDMLESNGLFYQREKVLIDGKKAWMYFIIDSKEFEREYRNKVRIHTEDEVQVWTEDKRGKLL